MKNTFQSKIDDFVKWSELAFTHYQNGYYADALTNMRKSGEAACKLMIIHRFTGKVAQEKIADRTYKELIQMIIRYGLAPRQAINWLEALQIHGNIATHDNEVMKEQAQYGITALRMLVQWLFEDFLKILVPANLEKAMSQTSRPVKTAADGKKLKTELYRLKKEREGLQGKLQLMEGKTQEEAEKTSQLQKELDGAEAKIQEMELLRQKAALLEKELAHARQQQEQVTEKPAKTPVSKKALIGVAAAIILLVGGWFLVDKIIFGPKTAEELQEETATAENTMQPNTLKALILPLAVLQDNPNLTLKVEDALAGRLRQRIVERKLPISLHLKSGLTDTPLTVDNAVQAGKKENAALVFYGELYEPATANDSVRIDLKYVLTREGERNSGYITIKAFRTLTDSAFMHLQTQVETVLDFTLADYCMGKRKYSDALALLYTTKTITKWAKITLHNFLAECHYNLQNYPAAAMEVQQYIELSPEEAYPYAFMANLLKATGQLEESAKYYEQSLLLEPNNINTLLYYADLLSSATVNQPYKAKELVLQAIGYDSTHSEAWRYLGNYEYLMENYTAARGYFRKSIELNTANTAAKKGLAEVLAFHFGKPEEAEELLSEILRKDSADGTALFTLANIYTSTRLANPAKAQYLFKKSERYLPSQQYSNAYGQGLAAYQKQDFKTAVKHYLKAYNIDSSDITLSCYISQAYLMLKKYGKALKHIEYAYELDTMNYLCAYNLGYFYYLPENKKYYNVNKAAYFFEKALITYPYDTLALEFLSTILFNQRKIDKTRKLLERLYSISPGNYYANKGLGAMMEREMNYEKAVFHYRKAMEAMPTDSESYSKLAYVMMKVSDGNLTQAMKYAQKAVELNPQSAYNMFILSQFLLLTNDYSKSADYYYKATGIDPTLKDQYMEEALKKAGY